ncbi:MAG: glycosyltransferase family 4 protein [Alphaproteobacteria bacterium]|nr:glycosyltransferase family 4 protein [Alphaproteobacteria bacterium]
MRILLSAYACEPGVGSEPEVGWRWAVELAGLGHEVWVLTRTNNRPAIEKGLATLAGDAKPRFLYYDLPGWAGWWKKGRRGIHLYYLLWQWGARRVAQAAHAEIRFERIHHVTLVSARQPSFLGSLGVPFAFGPAGGGERAPFRLRVGYGARAWVEELLRDGLNALVRFDPLLRRTYRAARQIYVTSAESRRFVPARDRAKTAISLAIGFDVAAPSPPAVRPSGDGLRLLYVGRFLDLKGMHLGLPAFAAFAGANPEARLTLLGDGPDKTHWQRMVERLGLTGKVIWRDWTAREKLDAVYAEHDLFFFPSLRDSGGLVVLEAMAQGLPVVCLDRGGPGVIVDASAGRAVGTEGRDRKAVIAGLAEALGELERDPALRARLSEGARARVHAFTWAEKVARIMAEA